MPNKNNIICKLTEENQGLKEEVVKLKKEIDDLKAKVEVLEGDLGKKKSALDELQKTFVKGAIIAVLLLIYFIYE